MRRLLLLVLFLSAPAASTHAAAVFPVIGRLAPDFTLTDQSGRQVKLDQFRGKIVLLNFIYAHCTDICPITTANLLQVQRGLKQRGWWAKDVVFISVTTDPARDTPAALMGYARRYGADPSGWHFLTGKNSAVTRVHRAYGIEVRPVGGGLQEHHLPTFVIDRRGMVLGAYGASPHPPDVLADLAKLR